MPGLTDRMMETLADRVHTSFYLRYVYTYKLRNIETEKMKDFRTYLPGIPRMVGIPKARVDNQTRRNLPLPDNLDRPGTKWEFVRFIEVQLTAILGRDALVGTGPLPNWLRRKRELIAVDTFSDNLCLFRCLAMHQGRRADRSTTKARELATAFYDIHVQDIPMTNLDKIAEIEKRLKLGICVYETAQYVKGVDARNGPVWSLSRQPAQYPNVMTIGMFEEHAFYIKDIRQVSNLYLCDHRSQSFTQAYSLQRHADRCTQGVTQVKCPGDTVEAPQSAYEKAFDISNNTSNVVILWLE